MALQHLKSILCLTALGAVLLPAASGQDYNFQTFSFPFPDTSPPSWNHVWANGINYQGVIVGTFSIRDPVTRNSYVYRGFKRYPNGYLEYPFQHPQDQSNLTQLTAINDLGEMAGTFWNLEPHPVTGVLELHTRAFTYANGVYSTLSTGNYTIVSGMNNLGDLAGYYGMPQGIQSFVRRAGLLTLIGPPGRMRERCYAHDVAADGTVVGEYGNHSFIRGPRGNYLRIRVRDATYTSINAINNTAGKVVGSYAAPVGGRRAFVYDYRAALSSVETAVETRDEGPAGAPLRIIDVETLDIPEFTSETAHDINAHGVIVGSCANTNTRYRGFIATPRSLGSIAAIAPDRVP